ncbi:LrgB family protein [Paenibacillus agaridevorans]|uniref:LrgB family protein n=1 Tax=Paenibacillus agaridevorans TaxID=171404 RepID=UPI001BE4CD23|nr:LrgB family protein [Paenibacillus agaridevorans]
MNALDSLLSSPVFGVTVTVGFYVLSLHLQRRWLWLHPLFLTSGGTILLLILADIPYESYAKGGDIITFFLGPATVALAVPLYKRRYEIREHFIRIVGSITVGSAVGIASSWFLVFTFGGSWDLLIASLSKSATSAISVELSRSLGKPPELAAVLTVLTGLTGSMLGPPLLRLLRLDGAIPLGLAIGTASHGIGTSRLMRDNEQAGSYAGLAMGITGIVISILFIPIVWWLH